VDKKIDVDKLREKLKYRDATRLPDSEAEFLRLCLDFWAEERRADRTARLLEQEDDPEVSRVLRDLLMDSTRLARGHRQKMEKMLEGKADESSTDRKH
jgi:hypothetical protein